MKNYNGTIGKRTLDLPAYSAVPQPTAPLTDPYFPWKRFKNISISSGCFIDWHPNVRINLSEPSEIQGLKLKLELKFFWEMRKLCI